MMHPLPQHTETELLQLLAAGSEEAFTELYNRYWKRLFALAAAKLGDMADAEETVQEIFVSLWNRRASLQVHTGLERYLAVSVKYRVIKALARRQRERSIDAQAPSFDLADHSTQQWLDFDELQERLEALVQGLPEKCQLVYRLSREKGYSQQQIAETLHISEKTVEAHLGKAIKTLRHGLHQFFLTLL
ncbi:RNA polymerase sigma-70 factor [Chitinophaga lutea]